MAYGWLIQNWAKANGGFLYRTGKSLRTLPSTDLYDIAMYLMFLETKTTEDEAESAETFRRRVADMVYEHETGMPAISQFMPPADAFGGE